MSEQEAQGTSTLTAIFYVIFISIIATSIVNVLLQTSTGTINFDLNKLYSSLTDIQDVINYGALVIGFALGGLSAGITTKDAAKGFVSGFFGAFLGGVIAFILANLDIVDKILATGSIDPLNNLINIIPSYILGIIGIMIVAAIFGWGGGKTTQKEKKVVRPKARLKSWQKKDVWTCQSCGSEIPPGKTRCPNCGRPVY